MVLEVNRGKTRTVAYSPARWMDSVREDRMPIRMTYWDKCLDEQQVIAETDSIVPLTGYPKAELTRTRSKNSASYADQSNYCWGRMPL